VAGLWRPLYVEWRNYAINYVKRPIFYSRISYSKVIFFTNYNRFLIVFSFLGSTIHDTNSLNPTDHNRLSRPFFYFVTIFPTMLVGIIINLDGKNSSQSQIVYNCCLNLVASGFFTPLGITLFKPKLRKFALNYWNIILGKENIVHH
jgi:hypothetical protein